ncbi:DinB family protein [uncultured Arthrobacter sp.]|uniref:DinB family protein n=1 Tax=uncultured Arthrobacter sp. TaxID=114050 RepID=UPI003217ACA8
MTAPLDRAAVIAGYRRNCAELEAALAAAVPEALRRRSAGTRWSNEELLYHMVFGYMVVLALLPLVRLFGRLPVSANRGFARLLNAGTAPFDVVNYWGSKGGARIFNRRRMVSKLRRLTSALERRLDRESESGLGLRMYFPTRWDPFFKETMTLADVYAYPVAHFDFHAAQLSLDGAPGAAAGA